jgi:chromosome segregation ATPase
MELIYIIFLSIFGFTFLALFIHQLYKNKEDKAQSYKELDRVKEDYHQTLDENEELENKVNLLADEVRNYYKTLTEERHSNQNAIDALLSEKVRVEQELIQLQSSIQVEAVKNDSKESLEAELENLKALAVEKMSELQQITANTQKLAASQNEKLEEIAKLEAGIKALEGRIDSGKKVLENLEDEIISTNNHLQLLVTLKANVLAVESGEGSV